MTTVTTMTELQDNKRCGQHPEIKMTIEAIYLPAIAVTHSLTPPIALIARVFTVFIFISCRQFASKFLIDNSHIFGLTEFVSFYSLDNYVTINKISYQ